MNYAHIYYFNTRVKRIRDNQLSIYPRLPKPPRHSFPWCITCLIPMQKEPHVLAPTGTPQLPLRAVALCNNGTHSLFPNDIGIKEKFLHVQKCHQQLHVYCWICLAHSAFRLEVTPSTFHFYGSMRKPFQQDDEMNAQVCPWVQVLRTYFFPAGIKLAHQWHKYHFV